MLILFLIGLIIGSFLNVLIYRLNNPKAPKWWQGRSLCPNCQHQISWFDNIPLLSFFILGRKCRFCHKNISWQYPVVEAISGLSFFVIGFQPLLWGLAAVFIVIFFSDLIYGFIPDEMIIFGVILSLGEHNLIVGILTALPFFVLAKFNKMGYGDVTLAFFLGFLLGWPKIGVALWSGFVIGGVVAVILLGLRKTKLSATIPLGPFLILGTIISALWTNHILQFLGVSL